MRRNSGELLKLLDLTTVKHLLGFLLSFDVIPKYGIPFNSDQLLKFSSYKFFYKKPGFCFCYKKPNDFNVLFMKSFLALSL